MRFGGESEGERLDSTELLLEVLVCTWLWNDDALGEEWEI